MKIGLLLADHVDAVLQSEFGDLPAIYQAFLAQQSCCELDVFDLPQLQFPSANYCCDAFVITGSRANVHLNEGWIQRLTHLIRQNFATRQKTIGICFGHQIIAQALGGQVVQRGWNLGLQTIAIQRQQAWMQPARASLDLIFNHQYQVVVAPEHTQVLAGNLACPIAMMQVADIFLGLQAHPEYSTSYQEKLMKNLSACIEPQQIQQAKQNNQRWLADHSLSMAKWICQFIGKDK